ncbi:Astacin-like metalloendopeptidase [Strongyloides ratti]|uniref:Metalloendopeptidase n=1 Tax=Strongyloides ratti TaxID=34506 RepID=A0A090LNX2_STRRB|nr:Astacin-like metalloendopeptidase [Strongyloides ratti]CEF69889.1 Astacin-like metalloendopeptidase [Strongyloides ratti]
MKHFFNIILFLILLNNINYSKNEEDKLTRNKKAVIQRRFKWNLPIKYNIHRLITNFEVIIEAIQRIENKTCITFESSFLSVSSSEGFNIIFTNDYCFPPSVPKFNDRLPFNNTIYISPKCQNNVGIIEILIGRMLGLLYEVNRDDRDFFIDINYDNINDEGKKLVVKYDKGDDETYYTGYDFMSGLHFSSIAFSKNNRSVFIPKDFYKYYQYSMGQSKGLSFNDYKVLAFHYCDSKLRYFCNNFGYKNPSNKDLDIKGQCICPTGYSGVKCENNIENYRKCGQTNLIPIDYWQSLRAERDVLCSYSIKTTRRYKIELTIIESRMPQLDNCYEDERVEVKYRVEKGTGGVCLCGNHKNITFLSERDSMLIIYNSLKKNSKLVAMYRRVLARPPKEPK